MTYEPEHIISYSISSSVNGFDLQFTRCDCGQSYISFKNYRVNFTTATVRNNGRSPQRCFILFRNVLQDSVTSLNLKIERQDLSKHASNLWKQLKSIDIPLIDEFKRIAHLAARQFYSSEIRIINVTVQNTSVAVQPIVINTENDEGIQELLKDLFPETLPVSFLHD
ncbi:19988_t:CDS:1 [Cetraspora pellucida]|uniref:19988_t:CDS:1 n=1 Tax=Cetraspora pellucida TaxID=1433469 RepID=A0A9N9BIS4_9GLOM|nr:19988_t:CDS:1 [Cetraspora pellucida]